MGITDPSLNVRDNKSIMDDKTPGKLTLIDDARKKKKDKTNEPDRLRTAEVYKALADAIRGQSYSVLPPFPLHYEVLEPERGARLALLVEPDQVVSIVRKEALAKDILTYCDRALGGRPDFALKPQQAREAADYYLMTSDPLRPETIEVVRWHDDQGLTYRRLPWPQQTGPAPTWEALLSRMTNAHAFIDWLGSLFFAESSLQNYVWLYGFGGDGKGSINRFLAKVFGQAYRSKQPPGGGRSVDKFWTYGILGARLVAFPDCDDADFVSKGLFKSLTGGDPVDLEAKGQMSFTARLTAKYLPISNDKPNISSERADMRRIIFCQIGKAADFDPKFEEKLWEEGGHFLSICVDRYRVKYPDHRPIETDLEEIEGWVSTLEEPYEVVFHKWFRLGEGTHVVPGDMQRMLQVEWPRRRRDQLDFLRWLEKTHGVKRAKKSLGDGVRQWRYDGAEMINFSSNQGPSWEPDA